MHVVINGTLYTSLKETTLYFTRMTSHIILYYWKTCNNHLNLPPSGHTGTMCTHNTLILLQFENLKFIEIYLSNFLSIYLFIQSIHPSIYFFIVYQWVMHFFYLLISSPARCLSKNSMSCFINDSNSFFLIRHATLSPTADSRAM